MCGFFSLCNMEMFSAVIFRYLEEDKNKALKDGTSIRKFRSHLFFLLLSK